MENLRTKIYLMVITIDLNLIENNENEAYNQEEDFSEIFYYNLNKIENPTIEYKIMKIMKIAENLKNLYNE